MSIAVEVRTPCRLHFGMFSFGHSDRAQFGGIGAMIEPPGVGVRISAADRFAASGSLANRTQQLVELLVSRWSLPSLPACEIAVRSPRGHTGLGVGTQLSLAVASGLRRFLHLGELPLEELAMAMGRGVRSAVGTYGFRHGGLIVDAGKGPEATIGKLAARVELPDRWRFVLFCRCRDLGLAGSSEATAFAGLPPVPDGVTHKLWTITTEQMLPAARDCDCTRFGEAVYRFGRMAGDCFFAVQGGPYANAGIARLVESIREFGVPGVGQSSWGPTVFAVTENDQEAIGLVDWFQLQHGAGEYEITIAHANNCGATIEYWDEMSR